MFPPADRATPAQTRAASVAFAGWLVVWLGLAAWVAADIYNLRQISTTVISTGQAVGTMATALGALSHLPLAGKAVHSAALQLHQTASSLLASGTSSRTGIGQLSYLLGISVALLPTVPFAVVFTRVRVARRRERQALQSALADPRRRPVAVRYLAGRAATNLPYPQLADVQRRAGAAGRHASRQDRLARAELDRLGLGAAWEAGAGPTRPGG